MSIVTGTSVTKIDVSTLEFKTGIDPGNFRGDIVRGGGGPDAWLLCHRSLYNQSPKSFKNRKLAGFCPQIFSADPR